MQWIEQQPAVPEKEGWYRVMHHGDSESIDGHVVYAFDDYEGWAYWTPASPDELEDDEDGYEGSWNCVHDEESEFIFAYLGPFEFESFKKYEKKTKVVPAVVDDPRKDLSKYYAGCPVKKTIGGGYGKPDYELWGHVIGFVQNSHNDTILEVKWSDGSVYNIHPMNLEDT